MIKKFGLLGLIVTLSPAVISQEIDYPDSFNEPMRLFTEAMGNFHFPISSDNENAQKFFNQGFGLG